MYDTKALKNNCYANIATSCYIECLIDTKLKIVELKQKNLNAYFHNK